VSQEPRKHVSPPHEEMLERRAPNHKRTWSPWGHMASVGSVSVSACAQNREVPSKNLMPTLTAARPHSDDLLLELQCLVELNERL